MSGGQFDPTWGGQFEPKQGGQFDRSLQLWDLTPE